MPPNESGFMRKMEIVAQVDLPRKRGTEPRQDVLRHSDDLSSHFLAADYRKAGWIPVALRIPNAGDAMFTALQEHQRLKE